MPPYSKSTVIAVVLLVIALICALFYWLAKPNGENNPEASNTDPEPVAQVETVKLQQGKIRETLTAYGVVLPLPDKLKTVSVSYTAVVDKIQVNQGQIVQKDDPLLTLKAGADAVLQLGQAQSELNAAVRENKLLRERIRLKLATQQDLVTSRLRVEQAKVMLKNLADRGIGKKQHLTAENSGMIYLVSAQQGQIVPAGAPLLQIVDQNQWVVRLGIEPEDYKHLQIDQPVLITPVNQPASEPVKGRLEIITHLIDPSTRLLNIYVRPESNQSLLINDFVEARIVISTLDALQVPRQAVLPDNGGYSLFTIENNRAVKHRVRVGIENDTHVQVLASDLKEQDTVVILGNYELEQGMLVSAIPVKGVAQ